MQKGIFNKFEYLVTGSYLSWLHCAQVHSCVVEWRDEQERQTPRPHREQTSRLLKSREKGWWQRTQSLWLSCSSRARSSDTEVVMSAEEREHCTDLGRIVLEYVGRKNTLNWQTCILQLNRNVF